MLIFIQLLCSLIAVPLSINPTSNAWIICERTLPHIILAAYNKITNSLLSCLSKGLCNIVYLIT